MDFAIKEELYPKFYYWIAHHAMKGAMCNIQRPTKDSTTLWDDVKCKPARIAILENIPTHNEGPFTSLSTFLRDKDRMRVSSNSDASMDSSSSDESSNNNYDMIWKEFKAFCAIKAGKLSAHINDLQRRPLKELLAVTTERRTFFNKNFIA